MAEFFMIKAPLGGVLFSWEDIVFAKKGASSQGDSLYILFRNSHEKTLFYDEATAAWEALTQNKTPINKGDTGETTDG